MCERLCREEREIPASYEDERKDRGERHDGDTEKAKKGHVSDEMGQRERRRDSTDPCRTVLRLEGMGVLAMRLSVDGQLQFTK